MSSPSQSSRSDGRTERRDDNILLALRTAQCLFDEGMLVPSIEDVAKRSGLSPRSLYRYFEDRQTMVRQAIDLVTQEAYKLGAIDNIGVHIIDEEGMNEFLIPREWYQGSGYQWESQNQARHAVQHALKAEPRSGKLPTRRPHSARWLR